MTSHSPPAAWQVWLYDRLPNWLRRTGIRLLMPTYPVAVAVVVFNSTGDVLLLHHTYGRPAWRLPGGLVERKEEVSDAARREVAEEASCSIELIGLADAAVTPFSLDIAVAARLTAEHPFAANPETDARQWLAPDEVRGLSPAQERFVRAAQALWANFPGRPAAHPTDNGESDKVQ